MNRFRGPEQEARDAELVARLKSHDTPDAQQAFRDLFLAYVQELSRVAQRMTGSLETAQDIVQDIFVWVWDRREDLPDHELAPYLFRAVRNRTLKVIDHEAVARRWEVAVRLEASDGGEEPSEGNEGERTLELMELSERLNAALATLTPRAREIIQLSHQDGLKPGQIAEVLGIAPTTVYAVLSRALKQLAEELRR